MPGRKVESGESLAQTALREIKEETGLDIHAWQGYIQCPKAQMVARAESSFVAIQLVEAYIRTRIR